jgi:4-hydroxybenzoate polyprenyltransferase
MHPLLQTFRPKHWVKNLFVLAPMIFSAQALSVKLGLQFAAGFAVFCLLSSIVYVLNDIADIPKDRLHPLKKNRPLAAGTLKPGVAWVSIALMALIAVPGAFFLDKPFFVTGIIYLLLNLVYSFGLKKVVVVDAICVAIGFVLRVIAGAALVKVIPTAWILMSTFFLALFLAFSKRRQEIAFIDRSVYDTKAALMNYNIQFLDNVIMIVSSCTIMCYALFSLSDYAIQKFHSRYLIATVPFVVFGIFRYFHLVYNRNRGEDPTAALLTDFPLQISIAAWVGTFVGIIYFF